jgi:Ca2+-binding RTX toxin-like protein
MNYYPGVGTPDTQFLSSIFPAEQSEITARQIISDFAQEARNWLVSHPGKTGADITMMMTTFSRGSGPGAIVSQLLQQEGLVYDGKTLIPPDQSIISAALILSPVDTGSWDSNLGYVNVKNFVEVLALDEYRDNYVQSLYGNAYIVFVPGNHGDIGSFYDAKIGGITVQGYTKFFNTILPGMMKDPLPERQFLGSSVSLVDIHAETFNFFTAPWNTSYGEYDEKNPTPLKTIDMGIKPYVELIPGGDKTTYIDYKGDTVVTTHINGATSVVVTPPDSITSSFNSTTKTDSTPTNSNTTDETPISADNSTLINDGISNVKGVGDVNLATGITAWLNDTITSGYRPGNDNLSTNYIPTDFSIQGLFPSSQFTANALNNATTGLLQFIPTDPLVLDINGDGIHLTDYGSSPVLFDVDHDANASKEQTGWVSNSDGMVVYDLNGNGKIDGIHETLSEYFNGGVGVKNYANGLAALKSLDSNNDNQFTSADVVWSEVMVWVDANHDGMTDAGELKTLTALGITDINLTQTVQSGLVRDGNEILASSTFVQNGVTREALAANFIANPNGSTFITSDTGFTTTTEGNIKSYSAGDGGETVDVSLKGVNNAIGGTGNDTLTGDAGKNWLFGGQGADILIGGAGDDVLLIDANDTQIDGGDGTDLVQVIGDVGVTLNLGQSSIGCAERREAHHSRQVVFYKISLPTFTKTNSHNKRGGSK